MQDLATLSFNIDSAPVVQGHQALDQFATQAVRADRALQGFGERAYLTNNSVASFSRGAGESSTQLGQMAASLQGVVRDLQNLRAGLGLTERSFRDFSTARDRAEALATSLGTGVVAMEAYASAASRMHMTSMETAAGIQRVTSAIEAQTAAGRQLREIMQEYGVSMTGRTAGDADRVFAEFVAKARSYQPSQGNSRIVQEVLGPLGVESLTSVLNQGHEPVQDRERRLRVEAVDRSRAEMIERATASILSSRTDIDALSDLRSNYDFKQFSPDQMQSIYRGMDVRPLSLQDPRNELAMLRFLDRDAPADLRKAGRRPRTSPDPFYDPGIGEGPDDAMATYRARQMNIQAQRGEQIGRDGSIFGPGGFTGLFRLNGANSIWDSALGRWVTNSAQNAVGRDATRPLEADSRPMSAVELQRQQAGLADGLAGVGFTEPARIVQADQRIEALTRGYKPGNYSNKVLESPDFKPLVPFNYSKVPEPDSGANADVLNNLIKAYIRGTGPDGRPQMSDRIEASQEATPRYDNMLDLARVARQRIETPGGSTLAQVEEDRWMLSVPPEQRGRARAMLRFGQAPENGISTSRWAEQNLMPSGIMALGQGPGSFSPRQKESFRQIEAGEDQNYLTRAQQTTDEDVQIQQRIRDAIEEGSAAVERATARWQAWTAAMRAQKTEAQAGADARAAETAVIERQTTAARASEVAMRQSNEQARTRAASITAAGFGPARDVAAINAGIEADLKQEQLRLPATDPEAFRTERRGALAIQVAGTAEQRRADAQVMIEQERQITAAAGMRGDVQKRLISDLQVEREYHGLLMQAIASKDEAQIRGLRETIGLMKEVRGEMESLRTTAANLTSARDTNWRAGVQGQINEMTPPQRREFQYLAPVLEQNRTNPAIMGSPSEVLPRGEEQRGARYDPYFLQAANATGGRITPEVMAVLAYREGSLLADPPTNGTGGTEHRGMMQFDAATAQRRGVGLTVNDTTDDRLDPSRAIPAAGRYIGQILDRQGITGPVTDLPTLHRILGAGGYGSSFTPQINQLYERALGSQSGDPALAMARLRSSNDPSVVGAVDAARVAQQQDERFRNIQANEAYGSERGRNAAGISAILAGTGDFGRQIMTARFEDPSSPNAREDAQRRVGSIIDNQRLSLAGQTANYDTQIRGLYELAEAYDHGKEAGEQFERHLTSNNMIRALEALKKEMPGLAKEIDEVTKKYEAFKPQTDQVAGNQAKANFQKRRVQMDEENEMLEVDASAGPFASAARLGRERASLLADRAVIATKDAVDKDGKSAALKREDVLPVYERNESLKQLMQDQQQVRQGYLQMKESAMQAFEAAVLGGGKTSDVLNSLLRDLERFMLRSFVTRPLMKGFENVVDGATEFAGKAAKGLFSSSSTSAAGTAASAVGSAAGAAASGSGSSIIGSLFSAFMGLFAEGGVVVGGQPIRYLASGGVIDRPTLFQAASGAVMAGEIDNEAILPLKRLGDGKFGIQAASRGKDGVDRELILPLKRHAGGALGVDLDARELARADSPSFHKPGLSDRVGSTPASPSMMPAPDRPIFLAQGGVISGRHDASLPMPEPASLMPGPGQPIRYLASGGVIDRPTLFQAASGAVMAGEIDNEAILPLKRLSSGNLGVQASGGGGRNAITINAPITIQGGATGRDGRMDPSAAANTQRQIEMLINQAVRNTLTNERRDGGDLTVGI